MKDLKVIDPDNPPKAVFLSSDDEDFLQSGGIIEDDDTVDIKLLEDNEAKSTEVANIEQIVVDNKELDNKTLAENLDSGLKIMGIGMAAVFGVLTILYVVIKIMGQFAKKKNDKENNNEKN